MRVSATLIACLAATSLTVSPALAGPGTQPAKPVKPTSVGKPTTVPKSTASVKPSASSKPAKPVAAKPPTSGKPTSAKPTTSGAGKSTTVASGATTAPKSKSKGTSTATATTPASTGAGTSTPLNPIAEKIASKPNLSARLTQMLPVDPLTGSTMTLDKASLGFKNQGQFIAALHVSQNLGIPFTELKSRMVTLKPGLPGEPVTATQTGSLGQAIQLTKANADASTEVRRAEAQTEADLASPTAKGKKTTAGGAR